MTEKTPSDKDWEAAERRALPVVRRCTKCGSPLHTIATCPVLQRVKDGGR